MPPTFSHVQQPTKTKHINSLCLPGGFFPFKQRIYFLLFHCGPLIWITCSYFGPMYPSGVSMSCELIVIHKQKRKKEEERKRKSRINCNCHYHCEACILHFHHVNNAQILWEHAKHQDP